MQGAIKLLVRPLYHAARSTFGHFRATRILQDYAAHHRAARNSYASGGREARPLINDVTETKVRVFAPGGSHNFFDLSREFLRLIESLHTDIRERLECSRNCFFFPKLTHPSISERTSEIPAVQNGKVIAVQLKNYLDIDGLEELCSRLLPEVEQKIFSSHVIVDKVYIYRNVVSCLEDQVSWRWHYDNHPNEILKIMIYLTNVTEENGPFEYLQSRHTQEAACIPPRPHAADTLVSSVAINRYLSDGFEAFKITGPKGTVVLFDNNVVHKANISKQGHRDVIVLQLRPCHFRPERFIDSRWTGSFQHVDFNPNPYDYCPRPKPHMFLS